jgi:hypothetical protein
MKSFKSAGTLVYAKALGLSQICSLRRRRGSCLPFLPSKTSTSGAGKILPLQFMEYSRPVTFRLNPGERRFGGEINSEEPLRRLKKEVSSAT